MMRKDQIELWAVQVIEAIEAGRGVEDSLVEVKAGWPDEKKAARRLAGHANAARGASILWLLGVDEGAGVVGLQSGEFSEWWAKVRSQFNEVAPAPTEVLLNRDGKPYLAILFGTDQPPYVVKNPQGGPIALEVPWREGTAVRSAGRSDLLKVLVPLVVLPSFEVRDGNLEAMLRGQGDGNVILGFELTLDMYVELPMGVSLVIPFHRCEATLEIPEFQIALRTSPWLRPAGQLGTVMARVSPRDIEPLFTIHSGDEQIIVEGPGPIHVRASWETSLGDLPREVGNVPPANLVLRLTPIALERDVWVRAPLHTVEKDQGKWARWGTTPSP